MDPIEGVEEEEDLKGLDPEEEESDDLDDSSDEE